MPYCPGQVKAQSSNYCSNLRFSLQSAMRFSPVTDTDYFRNQYEHFHLEKDISKLSLEAKMQKNIGNKNNKKADYIKSKLWTVCGQGLCVEPGTSSTNTKSRPVKLSTLEKNAQQPFLQVLIYSIKCRQLRK